MSGRNVFIVFKYKPCSCSDVHSAIKAQVLTVEFVGVPNPRTEYFFSYPVDAGIVENGSRKCDECPFVYLFAVAMGTASSKEEPSVTMDQNSSGPFSLMDVFLFSIIIGLLTYWFFFRKKKEEVPEFAKIQTPTE